jgi:hypothetical protein
MATTTDNATGAIATLVTQALQLLAAFGLPVDGLSLRRKTRMAKAFIAVAGLTPIQTWAEIKVNDANHRLRSRDVIRWMNEHLGEDISPGSYDDIRRKDLLLPVEGGLVLKAAGNDSAATNDGTRGYAINPDFAPQIRKFGTPDWHIDLPVFMAGRPSLVAQLESRRALEMLPVNINGQNLVFSPGEHNQIQKAIIEEFLPRFGQNAQVLYVGDAADKFLFVDAERLNALQFFEIAHDKLPDVLAYSCEKNWLYLIEAVHSANPMTQCENGRLNCLLSNVPQALFT